MALSNDNDNAGSLKEKTGIWQNKKKLRSYREFLYILPFLALVAIFSYYPLYGWVYAFFDYRPPFPLTMENFVGFKWFISMVDNSTKITQLWKVLRNTFAISGLSLGFSWFPMVFAVFLNEIRSKRYRKFVQTVTTLPNFISWVLVYSIAYSVLSSTGAVNSVLMNLGLIDTPQMFLQSSENVWFKMWLWLTWKNAGWAAIMYIAAISGIDEQLNEAARIDGASKLQIIWHITFPSLLPTYFVLVMLNLANFLSNGMEQFYVFQNAFNKEYIQVLDLYVYNLAMGGGGYSLSVAISIFKSFVSVLLLAGTNKLSKLTRGEGFI
ncbi:MAG: sugar ABC transporter permease [Thermoclostridium sp.]|nr:sugar ABC transporter permease [Thermoclostridium sp.]